DRKRMFRDLDGQRIPLRCPLADRKSGLSFLSANQCVGCATSRVVAFFHESYTGKRNIDGTLDPTRGVSFRIWRTGSFVGAEQIDALTEIDGRLKVGFAV